MYNKLSPKLQKEYDFRFKTVPVPNFQSYIVWLFILLLTVTVMLFTSYLMVTDDKFITHKDEATEALGSALNLTDIGLWILITLAIFDAARVLRYFISYDRWKRKNKIKGEPFWKQLKSQLTR